jgi:hypothetical protein
VRGNKIFLRLPPTASPTEKKRLLAEFLRRLNAEATTNPDVLKPKKLN